MELKGSKTEANLWEAFAGESQARNKYTYYASKARKEGFEQIAAFFEETANNEKEHAKLWFKELGGIGTTAENLMAAAEGEHEEWTSMYKRMAEEAREEGFHRIADMFAGVGEIEKSHYERYLKLVENLENNEVFKKSSVKVWYCRNCGHLEYGDQAPEVCATAATWSTATRPPRCVPCAATPRPSSRSRRTTTNSSETREKKKPRERLLFLQGQNECEVLT